MKSFLCALFVVSMSLSQAAAAAPKWDKAKEEKAKKAFCDNGCNRFSCTYGDFKGVCKALCPAAAVKNCVAATEVDITNPKYASSKGKFCDNACNRYSCTYPHAFHACESICSGAFASKITNCLKAGRDNGADKAPDDAPGAHTPAAEAPAH